MQSNEIIFTSNEMKLLRSEEFLITKRRCIDKVLALFGKLKIEIEHSVESNQWEELIPYSKGDVKIAKGDNYRELPYVNLDYPRAFDKEDIFLFRSMFWWGNFYSFTLHLQGSYLEKYRQALLDSLTEDSPPNLFIGCGKTPWQYHYESTNYCRLNDLSSEYKHKLISQKSFVKLSLKYPLFETSEELMKAGREAFEELISRILTSDRVM